MDYLTVSTTLKDFNKDYEEYEDKDEDEDKDKGGNGAAEAASRGVRGGAELFCLGKEGSFRPSPFPNEVIGGVPLSYSL